MVYEKLLKFEIAERQLLHAIDLYLAGNHLLSAITLAGAAEEILGKLVKRADKSNALEMRTDTLCELYEFLFKESADRKALRDHNNRARNELKHLNSNKTDLAVELNLDKEAAKLIKRAIQNYKQLSQIRVSTFRPFRDFDKKRLRRRCSM